jgi:hypothetical protein
MTSLLTTCSSSLGRTPSSRVAPSTNRLQQKAINHRTTTTTAKSPRGSAVIAHIYPDADYIAKVQSLFPAKGTATAEEGR